MTLAVRFTWKTAGFALHVEFEVPPGVTVLFGPSGSGKSRTLGCIAGIARPTEGRIALGDDVWFSKDTNLPIQDRRVAYVFQSLALFPHLSAIENVEYGISRAIPRAQRRARASEMLERMHVAKLADRRPATFSGGEAQRVALARAFAMQPRVLLLDEPFSALDRAVKRELLDEVRAWVKRESLPTILVTHQIEEAKALGERVVVLEAGAVVRRGSLAELDVEGR